jgi:hypothetical protein
VRVPSVDDARSSITIEPKVPEVEGPGPRKPSLALLCMSTVPLESVLATRVVERWCRAFVPVGFRG